MWAAIAIMVLLSMAVPLTDSGASGVRLKRTPSKVGEGVGRMGRERGWRYAEVCRREGESCRESPSAADRGEREKMVTREGRPSGHAILDMGEGWGSIGIAAAEIKEGCYTVGVDIATGMDQGARYGKVTAKVRADFEVQGRVSHGERARMACDEAGHWISRLARAEQVGWREEFKVAASENRTLAIRERACQRQTEKLKDILIFFNWLTIHKKVSGLYSFL